MRKIFGIGIAMFALSPASPAFALETGQCAPAADVKAELAAQNMQPIIVGNRTGYGYTASFIFFANADLTRGVLIRGDRPIGQLSEKACLDSVFREIRLNDVSKPGLPKWSLFSKTDIPGAEAICRRDHLGYQERCSDHNSSIIGQDKNNQRVMLMATGTAINPRDHSIREGQRIVLTLQPDKRIGLLEATTPEGANYMLSGYDGGAFTQFGSDLLDANR